MSWFSLLQIAVEEPETSENPTQSFEIQNAHTAFGRDNYTLYDIDIYV